MSAEHYDVIAKLPAGALRDQIPEMLQQLLVSRFGLATHHVQEEHTVPALVVAKSGLKLTPTPSDSDAPVGGAFRRSFSPDGSMQMTIRRYTMKLLAELVGRFLNQSIADATSIPGEYDLSLSFSPEDLRTAGVAPLAGSTAATASESSIGSSLARLGLKLEARKLPIDAIVVDHVEKTPTAN